MHFLIFMFLVYSSVNIKNAFLMMHVGLLAVLHDSGSLLSSVSSSFPHVPMPYISATKLQAQQEP